MTAKFEFGEKFQLEMLSLMLGDFSFAQKAVKYVPSERLHSEAHKFLFGIIKERVEAGTLPSVLEVEDALKRIDRSRRRLHRKFIDEVLKTPVTDSAFLRSKLSEFTKKALFIDIFNESQVLWNSKKFDDAYQHTMDGINEVFGVSFFDDVNVTSDRFEELRQKYLIDSRTIARQIPTAIGPIDRILRGGLPKKEMGIVLGEAKRGKSIALVHMGCAALMMRSGRVAHFVLEGSTEQTAMRYQSRLTGIEYGRIKADLLSDEEQDKLDTIERKYFDNLTLIPMNTRWDYTVSDIESKVLEMERAGQMPDMVIVDYGDILTVPETRFVEFRHQQMQIFRSLKQLAMVRNVALWTASQAAKPKEDPEKESVLRARDIAESYEKVRITDFLMTLNQTPREKKLGLLRIHIDTYRDNETDITIKVICDFSRMIFFSRRYGYLTGRDTPSWARRAGRAK